MEFSPTNIFEKPAQDLQELENASLKKVQEDLNREIIGLKDENTALKDENATLKKKVSDLRKRLVEQKNERLPALADVGSKIIVDGSESRIIEVVIGEGAVHKLRQNIDFCRLDMWIHVKR